MNKFLKNYANTQNPITKFFNKIYYASLSGDYSKKIKCLEAMKKVPLYVKRISIYSDNADELENLTDPKLHNTPIEKLECTLSNSFEISSKTIENLKAINPNSINIDYNQFSNDEDVNQAFFGNFTKLLSNLDQTSLVMDFNKYDFSNKLDFSDVIFKVVESNEECSYFRAKSVVIHCKDEDFCWIKSGDLNTSVLDSYYFCLNKSRYIKISEFIRIKDQEEIKEVEKMFNNESCLEINKGIIIPIKYSHNFLVTIKEYYF